MFRKPHDVLTVYKPEKWPEVTGYELIIEVYVRFWVYGMYGFFFMVSVTVCQ